LSSINTGSLVVVVGMMPVSNRSNRRQRLLLIIIVGSLKRIEPRGRRFETLQSSA
jgi:hypothetical protein